MIAGLRVRFRHFLSDFKLRRAYVLFPFRRKPGYKGVRPRQKNKGRQCVRMPPVLIRCSRLLVFCAGSDGFPDVIEPDIKLIDWHLVFTGDGQPLLA